MSRLISFLIALGCTGVVVVVVVGAVEEGFFPSGELLL